MLVLHGAFSGVVLCTGPFLPGWLLGRACRTDAGPVSAFLGSAALLLNLVLLLDASGMALDLPHLCAGLAVLCAGLAVLAAHRRASAASAPIAPGVASVSPATIGPTAAPRARFHWQFHHWFFFPAALGLSAIALRAALTPLSGFDTIFRWDFLAQQMLGTGHLHFYPPTTADDFRHYAWPDGIAPLVATLYLWSYLSLGLSAAWATVPVVLTSAALLWIAVWTLTAQHDRRAAVLACGLLGASSVLLWGVAMGQETALTALSLVAIFLFIERHRIAPEARWLPWAGIAAGVGGHAILVPDPTTHSQFVRLGAKPMPPFSPAARFRFAPDADFATCLARLRAEKVRFILTTRLSDLNDRQASAHPFFRTVGTTPPTAVFSHYRIYDLASPAR